MTNYISKRIFFRFENKFTKQKLFTVSAPYIPFSATIGYYSQLFKRIKKAAAFGFEYNLVASKHWFESSKSNRINISFPNGCELDVPYDLTEYDIDIIKHYLVGLQMSLKK